VTSLAKRLQLGPLALRLYHRPLGKIRSTIRQGGPLAMRETERQRREMEASAENLPALVGAPPTSPLCFHILTGRRFWYQTAYCLASLANEAGKTIRAEIYDDGSLTPELEAKLLRLGDGLRIHRQPSIVQRLEEHLPEARFPVLRELWRSYPNIRKLTDIHAGASGWKLVIDSDLLFFRCADVMLRWLEEPSALLHAVDAIESYGYSRALMERLAGAAIPSKVNVGLCGLRSDSLDWEELEAWCAHLIAAERRSYFLEQALVAMLAARTRAVVAPAEDYVTMPSRAEVEAPKAVMHHYVAESKRWYFRHGWRVAQARLAAAR
jgi:hypothetical protein